ncbi:MAG: peptide synthase [Marinilabiliales bacterium]|nr:MAG: peptide synthase [Marinilabiliales bacterium]
MPAMFDFPFIPSSDREADALCIEDKFYHYDFLNNRFSCIAQEIKKRNLRGQAIGLVASDHYDTYAAILAIWATGNTYVPINPYLPSDRIDSIISQAGIKLLMYSIDEVKPSVMPSEVLKLSTMNTVCESVQAVSPKDDEIAYILFTSGSTGTPKGVPVSYGNVRSFLRNLPEMDYDLSSHDRFLQMFDLSFDLSIVSILTPFLFKGCLFTVPNNNIKYTEIYRLLEEYEINFAILVPSVVAYLKPYFEDIDLPHMRYMCLSGEAVPYDLTVEWKKCCPNAVFQNLYGPSEATIYCVTYTMPRENIPSANGIVCIGRATKEIDCVIINENNKEVKQGEKGELILHGKQVIQGYLNNPEKDKEAFLEFNGKRYYRSGDICYQDENGLYFYLGRKDYQVKIQGFRIELSEVEHHISTSLNKRRVVALADLDKTGNARIIGVIEGDLEDKNALIADLKKKMPFYMIPAEFRTMSAFPLNNNGKIDRKTITKIQLENAE